MYNIVCKNKMLLLNHISVSTFKLHLKILFKKFHQQCEDYDLVQMNVGHK
jgi:hypothetical protein